MLVWGIKVNEDQYNSTMPMYSDGRRQVGLPFICSSKTALQTLFITEKGLLAYAQAALAYFNLVNGTVQSERQCTWSV